MMIALRKAIHEAIKTQCQTVYYHRASKESVYPRCIFSIDLYEDEGLQRGMLTVDVYDNQNQTEQLERITHNIRLALNRNQITTDKAKCVCYYDRVLVLDDDDKAINRRQLQFELRVYEERK